MAGRRTNLALLALLPLAVGTGALAFAIGSGWSAWAVVAHGGIALAVVILAPWKSAIARRGLRRARPGSGASLLFTLLIAVALAAGIGHSTGLWRTVGGLTAMQIHVGAALASIPFGVWHVLARRVWLRRTDLTRRSLLRAGGLAAAGLAVHGGLAGIVRWAGMPGKVRRFTGSFESGSFRPQEMPVTQWLGDSVPDVAGDDWRLSVIVGGEEVSRLTLEEVRSMAEPITVVLDCTGGWFARQEWEGVRFDHLFPINATGRSMRATSVTGYWRRFPAADLRHLWLATGAGSEPLSPGHGFPARIVAPNRRGFWWVKWVRSLELSDVPWWWQPPFPLQ